MHGSSMGPDCDHPVVRVPSSRTVRLHITGSSTTLSSVLIVTHMMLRAVTFMDLLGLGSGNSVEKEPDRLAPITRFCSSGSSMIIYYSVLSSYY